MILLMGPGLLVVLLLGWLVYLGWKQTRGE